LDKDFIIQQQYTEIKRLTALVTQLTSRIVELEQRLQKNSSNSSKPPSSDFVKPPHTKSLRSKSDKKLGGQNGHKGETLAFSQTPQAIIDHSVNKCTGCGTSLVNTIPTSYDRRQVFDIPPIKMFVTEHRCQIKDCPNCGCSTKAPFPQAVSQPVQYGPNIQQLGVYFINYQLLPYQRTVAIFKDLFNVSLSESFLVNNNKKFALQLQPFIATLKEKLQLQPLLHADETGFTYNGKRNWLHTVCTEKHTLYAIHEKRGIEAMNEIGVLPTFTGHLVHDFWKPYNSYDCKHNLCNVHHLRDLTFCAEVEKSEVAGKLKQLLLDIYKKVEQAKDVGKQRLSKTTIQYWTTKFSNLVKEGLLCHPVAEKKATQQGIVKKSKTQNMLLRFRDYQEEVIGFMKNFTIPFGNNLAEQAIRMMKVKQKISGGFRSEQGAKDFADIRSYIATMKKQNHSILDALAAVINGSPFMTEG
jgi:transposase